VRLSATKSGANVRKSDLFELIRQIKTLLSDETPIIVGSQAVHLVTNFPPEIVQYSIECDFLIIGGKGETRAEINKKFGVFSNFQLEKGFYADALGLATVILPTNWQERLQSLKDETGETIGLVAEIHDIAVSKLIAGREKDFQLLKELFTREFIKIDIFIERVLLIKDMPQNAVLVTRLKSLEKLLSRNLAMKIRELLKNLQ
jgi:hypothetical protein